MRLIKCEITVPIPEVYSFNASTYHDLGYPFVLMELIETVPLYETWLEKTSSKTVPPALPPNNVTRGSFSRPNRTSPARM